jgi:hypothetical protein
MVFHFKTNASLFTALLLGFLLLATFCFSAENEEKDSLFAQGVTVNLRDPEYREGILKTEQGGVITAPNLRLQARKILYTRKMVDSIPVFTIEAEGDLLIEFGEYFFVGDRLEYDFQTKSGVIYNGRSGLEPWFFGGRLIYLEPEGSYSFKEAFLTTSENIKMDWQIAAEEASLNKALDLKARSVKFRIFNIPVLWLPSFKTNLNAILDSPIRYSFKWGGQQGPRGSLLYEFLTLERFKAFLRLDLRLNRGIGCGLETYYLSEDHLASLETINYLAQDSAIIHPDEQLRYRYQGIYNRHWEQRHLTACVTWDKLSDSEMATDYRDKGLELDSAGRTELHIRHDENIAISNFYTRVRVNSFQTLKQELPSFETHFRPVNLFNTDIISDSRIRSAYLDFKYANHLIDVHNYHSSRFEIAQKLYRHFQISILNVVPEVGGHLIFYDKSPQQTPRWLGFWHLGCEVNSRWQRYYNLHKHVMLPYIHYDFISYPSTPPHDHYIFDIQDGWYHLNMLTFGFQHDVYRKSSPGVISKILQADIYTRAFFNTHTIPQVIPKIYSVFKFYTFSFLYHTIDTAWDFEEHRLDHLNIRIGWTLSENAAIAAEYRHRDAYDWRKADHTNFIIDSYRSIEELRHSQLSDRRDTLLLHFYYRINPRWALEFESRNGWNRIHERPYTEFEVDLLATLQSACHLRLSYRYREEEKFRIAVNFNVGLSKPDRNDYNNIIPCLEF